MDEKETQELINSYSNPADISENIYSKIPDNIELIFSTFKKYETKKIHVIKSELYVGNLDRYLTYEDIYQFLSQFGEVEKLKLNYNFKGSDKGHKKSSKQYFAGNCFVKFKNVDIHEKLIALSNAYSLRNRKVVFSEKLEKIQSLEDIEKSCWFCYNNPLIEKDLIIKDFKSFYLAYPKGPIDNFHLIVLPKFHIKNFNEIPLDLLDELMDIIKTLKKFFADNSLEYVIYEKNLPYNDEKAKHMILNMIGIKKELSFQIFNYLHEYLNKNKLNYKCYNEGDWSLSDLKQENPDCYYHYVEIPSGINIGKSDKRSKFLIYHLLQQNSQSNTKTEFQDIARIVLCGFIDKKENINWKVYKNIIFTILLIFIYFSDFIMELFSLFIYYD